MSFSLTPNAGLVTGTQVSDQATIVFDVQPPMSTAVWTNTLDNTPPTSKVKPLPAHSCLDLNVRWSDTDVG